MSAQNQTSFVALFHRSGFLHTLLRFPCRFLLLLCRNLHRRSGQKRICFDRWKKKAKQRIEVSRYSWIHVTGDTTQKRAYLTEGPLKGDIASYFANSALFVCLGGVNAHKGLRETLQSLGVTEVMEAMDMDQFTNPQVRQAIGTLRREVQSIPGIRYYQCTWNPRFKGVDDYLLDWTKRKTA